jgi:hypothetical protein
MSINLGMGRWTAMVELARGWAFLRAGRREWSLEWHSGRWWFSRGMASR